MKLNIRCDEKKNNNEFKKVVNCNSRKSKPRSQGNYTEEVSSNTQTQTQRHTHTHKIVKE